MKDRSAGLAWLTGISVTTMALGAMVLVPSACSSQSVTYVDVPVDEDPKDGGFDSAPSPESGLGILSFMPSQSFTGFDGTHTFKVPVAVYDAADDLEVVVATNPSAATVVPTKLAKPVREDGTIDNGKYFMVTIKQAGTIKLTATSNGETVEMTITATQYDASRWTTGQARYNAGPDGQNPPCTQCHVQGSAIDHSPAALATAKDPEVEAIITTGLANNHAIKVDGFPNGHKWSATPTELAGLVTYLRALEPKGFK